MIEEEARLPTFTSTMPPTTGGQLPAQWAWSSRAMPREEQGPGYRDKAKPQVDVEKDKEGLDLREDEVRKVFDHRGDLRKIVLSWHWSS